MSDSSLVPERQLVFSPGLAATIGLEEAILLQHLQGQFDHGNPQHRGGYVWLRVDRNYLLGSLPFWSAIDLHRVVRSLVDKGVLLVDSPPIHSDDHLTFALNEPVRQERESAPPAGSVPEHSASGGPETARTRGPARLPGNWSPSEDLLQLLALNHNIPRQFALNQLEDFIFYWRERGDTSHAWENKFRQLVTSRWRREQQDEAESFRKQTPKTLDNHWRPNDDAMEIMVRDGIDPGFIEQTIPEFILYWRERGSKPEGLNSKFIQHIRMQWTRYSAGLERSTEPRPITDDWQPSADAFDILTMAHIDRSFAQSLVPEFILYWRESNQLHTSWNSKFLQHVKYQWARRHQLGNTDGSYDGQPGSRAAGSTRDRSLADDLSDTSWAD